MIIFFNNKNDYILTSFEEMICQDSVLSFDTSHLTSSLNACPSNFSLELDGLCI